MSKHHKSNTPLRIVQLSALENARRPHAHSRLVQYSIERVDAGIAAMIPRVFTVARQSFLTMMVSVMTVFYPVAVYATEGVTPETPPAETTTSAPAETPAPASETTQTPAPAPAAVQKKPAAPSAPKTGPKKPNGADSTQYKLNPETGMYESDKYIWDPTTGQSKPKTTPTYSYNPDTAMWDTEKWEYNPASGRYEPNVVSTSQLPSGVYQGDGSASAYDLYFNGNISNNIYSNATSGNAWVTGNTLGGNALTGDALAIANIFNMLQSSAGFAGGSSIATFSSDIYGDVFGDLYVDPNMLAQVQPANGLTYANDTEVNVASDTSIDNDVTLNVKSGDANVTKNTTGGDATSGDAHAVANIVNMLNSAISSGRSFIGTLNIHGSLNGDILLPTGMLTQLLASNAPTTTLGSNNIENAEVLAEFNDTQTINNNITAKANSGNATVDHNTTAGSATTGDALSNITVLNLTGRQVVAANSLLVFVNVLGEWVGVIMDAPAGSTSAALGTGVTQNSGVDATYNVDTASTINNNIDVNAQSGDANVTSNTTGGNATTGDATASVNVANIINSSMSLSDWFGVLFINVFDTWNGSFGIDTAAGEHPAPAVASSTAKKPAAAKNVKVFRFVPTENGGNRLAALTLGAGSNEAIVKAAVEAANSGTSNNSSAQVAGVTTSDDDQGSTPSAASGIQGDLFLPFVGFMIGGSILGGERVVNSRQRRRLTA